MIRAIYPIYTSTFQAWYDLTLRGKILSLNDQPLKMSSDLNPSSHQNLFGHLAICTNIMSALIDIDLRSKVVSLKA